MNILSIYLGHNASMTVAVDGRILEVLEFERLTNIKNGGCMAQIGVKNPKVIITIAKDYLMDKFKIKHFDLLLMNHHDIVQFRRDIFLSEKEILKFMDADAFQLVHHQHGHMAGAFYQSDLTNCKGVSFDGGGSDGNFNVFECNREKGIRQLEYIGNYTIGMRYAEIGQYTKSIRKEPGKNFFESEALVYPGKLMGLGAYGHVRDEWLPAFEKFYTGNYLIGTNDANANYKILKSEINLPDGEFDGPLEADVVATSQFMFETKFKQLIKPHFDDQNTIILTGGCALNILNNQKMSLEKKVFVPPNPHDGGLSLGFMLDYFKPKEAFNATYLGPTVWDSNSLAEYVEKHNGKPYTFKEIADDLVKGKIIGVVREGSELGPRALGNRSILCHAAIPNMKDILNQKVKNRESYRPFAPVCHESIANRFFETNMNSDYRWMSFCPTVREEYRETLASVTHADNTARLQTVTEQQNDWLFYLLLQVQQIHPIPVLINTSFNIAGKPILNTYRDAIWMLENTQLDGVILENYYVKKS